MFTSRGSEASIADVKPGVRINAVLKSLESAGAALQASRVVILDPPDGTLSGKVEAVDVAAGTLTVLGLTIGTTSSTRIAAGRGRDEMTLADIMPGDQVTVVVSATSSGLVAEQILVQPPLPDVNFAGTVKLITAEQWVITTRDGNDVTVLITPQTKIEGSPKVGDMVHVLGSSDAAGNIVALQIRSIGSRPQPPGLTRFEGVVRSIEPTEWLVDSVRVLVTPRTRIIGSPAVGDTVRVTGTPAPDGAVLAVAIEKK